MLINNDLLITLRREVYQERGELLIWHHAKPIWHLVE